ncbi:MAG: hypothetical protein E7658_00435 [Ruminococcaceae bacterium]|nr:hypothetical protein [Oscillospiraceae bacterium]
MRLDLCRKELEDRIRLNYHRLAGDPYYQIDDVFSPIGYGWMGDKEGRALLAFVSHYKISGEKIPCMEQMLEKMPSMVNEQNYLGKCGDGLIREEQLSGHSWLLRGLCEHYEQFGDDYSLTLIRDITANLFLPLRGEFAAYPIHRETSEIGGVSGTELGTQGKWLLSTDTCAAFMSIDGLSHAYKVTRDPAVKELLDEMIGFYAKLDKCAMKAQTHCTLTAGRAMMRMYEVTGEAYYRTCAEGIWETYVHGGGMTYTYHNLNWWGRPDTWSEPCAVVDSLMLSLELYKATNRPEYRTVAARIWHNAFATIQRANGGAGTDTVVAAGSPWDTVKMRMYEAPFCCTMRLAEGLWYIYCNSDLLWAETAGGVTKQENGVYADGDIVYAEVTGGAEAYADEAAAADVDGRHLVPIVKWYRVPDETAKVSEHKILFG